MVWNIVDAVPVTLIEQLTTPVAKTHVEQVDPFSRHKSRQVHAISDVADRVLGRRNLRPDVALHLRGYTAVNAANTVVKARAAQCQRGHIKAVMITLG